MADLPERALVAGRALVELGGTAAPGVLGERAGLGKDRRARALADLERAGLVDRNHERVALTPAGWAAFLDHPRPDAGDLDEALALWPYRHRAFVELALSAIVARHHLAGERRDGHLGLLTVGGTGTGKSAMAEAVCHLFGWDPTECTVMTPEQTEGSLRGRRERDDAGGWRLDPAAPTRLSFVFFDELDKAAHDLRRAVLPYFQGRTVTRHEGHELAYRPAPMLAANVAGADLDRLVPREYRRRSVLLDTGRARLDRDAELRAFHRDPRWRALLRLEDLEPPAAELPERQLRALATLPAVLTDAGAELFDARQLELAVLGRAGLVGADLADLDVITFATTHDYLACTESVPGLVAPDWHLALEDIRQQLAAAGDTATLAAALARRRAAEATAEQTARRTRQRVDVERLALVERRARLVQRIDRGRRAARHVPEAHREAAAGARAQLDELHGAAGRAKTAARLAELEALAEAPLATVERIRAAVAAERIETTRAAEQVREQRREATRDGRERQRVARAQAAAHRKQLGEALDDVRARAKEIERLHRRKSTRPGENPLAVLTGEQLPDGRPLIAYEPPRARPEPRSLLGQLGRTLAGPPTGAWFSPLDPAARFAGSDAYCEALASWGPATRHVLELALAELHAAEDHLQQATGRKSRKRPAIATSSTTARRDRPAPGWRPATGRPVAPGAPRRSRGGV